jgi:type I restriction-modification system DNA methylase subunit
MALGTTGDERAEKIARIKDLVRRFDENRDQFVRPDSPYNEAQLRQDFINPFLGILGWDVENKQGAPQYLREVVVEPSVDVEKEDEMALLSKRPDYALRAAGERMLFVEAKKPSVQVEQSEKAAFQVRRYGWNARLPISVLTNFDRLVIYDCRYRPKPEDNPGVARLKIYSFTEYAAKFDEIYDQLSRSSVYSGKFSEVFPIEREVMGKEAFGEYFLHQIEDWRESLAKDLAEHNSDLSQDELNLLVQRLINRIFFLRICEDRELEKYKTLKEVTSYEELKRLFHRADEKYNSGLFDFIEDELSLSIDVGSDVLVRIFKELYYPESPYAFSVIEPTVLGEIYELFLGKTVHLGERRQVSIEEKPEVVESGGVVPTPRYIVDSIVKRTLDRVCVGRSPDELQKVRIADIACGSGTFLLEAYDYLLNYHLEWYLEDGPTKHKEQLYQVAGNAWHLTLNEKQRILLNSVFGVDIDIQAVEVTRFGLLLKVLENESAEALNGFLSKFQRRALPSLDDQVQCGNSLVDQESFASFDPNGLETQEQMAAINPLDWEKAFPTVMKQGGFDAIVGNPPYIRIQNMVKYSPREVEFYQSKGSPYSCAKNDNFDKYALFIERALSLLKRGGFLGYIVPHKFFVIKSGRALRKLLASNGHVAEIVHFGVEQVFVSRTTTYTCILILAEDAVERFRVQYVSDLSAWRLGQSGELVEHDATELGKDGENPWEFLPPNVKSILDRLRSTHRTKLDETADIFVGVQTSADKIYIIKPIGEKASLIRFLATNGKQYDIERSILRPCLMDVQFQPFGTPEPNSYIIFPYKIANGKAQLYSLAEMKGQFPRALAYLADFKSELDKRDILSRNSETWHQYGRSQSLTKFDGRPKLIWPILSLAPRYNFDDKNTVITGGGNGPYYALRPVNDGKLSIYYIQAILSHLVIDTMVASRASRFRGGYVSHGKQFIQEIPVPIPDMTSPTQKDLYDEIVRIMKTLNKAADGFRDARSPEKKRVMGKLCDQLRTKKDGLVARIYGLDEVQIREVLLYRRTLFLGEE